MPVPEKDGSLKNTWAIHQLKTTVNFSPKNRIINWFTGGLNHQVEHHIFPNIYPGKIKTCEEYFDCDSFFKENNDIDYLSIFREERNTYRWNTFITLDI